MNEAIRTLLSLSLGGGALALLLLAVKAVFGRKLPSAFYYYAWLLVLVRFVVPLPGLIRLEPPAAPQTQRAAVSQTQTAAARGGTRNVQLPTAIPDPQPLAAGTGEKDTGAFPASPAPDPVPTASPLEQGSGTAPSSAPKLPTLTAAQWAAAVWAVGAAALAGWTVLCYLRFSRGLNRTLRRASASQWRAFRALGGPDRLRLCRSGVVQTPMQLGMVDARLVLPDRSYSDEMLNNILRHELTHYNRHDILYKWFTALVCALHWFNPLVWLARREIDRQCELSCDERLLRTMTPQEKQSYGQTLLELACDRAPGRAVIATSFATEKRNLKERLEQIMTYKRKGWTTVLLALCVLLALVGCGVAAGPAAETSGTTAPTALPDAAPAGQAQADLSYTTANVAEVSNVDEFLAAIAPDTTIVMKAGEYNLASAGNYPKPKPGEEEPSVVNGGDYYNWTNTGVDGYGLFINGVQDLTIQAAPGETVTLLAEPRYADVLRFVGSDTVAVKNLIAGHTDEPSTCAGAVLAFDETGNIQVEGCQLFGCGTLGVIAWDCENLLTRNCDIYDCSLGAVQFYNTYNAQVDGCDIYGCKGTSGLMDVSHCQDVALTNSTIHNNMTASLVSTRTSSSNVYLGGLTVEDNAFTSCLYAVHDFPVTFEGCRIADSNMVMYAFQGRVYFESAPVANAVDKNGRELSEDALRAMTQKEVTWTAQERVVPESPEPGADGQIHVSTVDELLSAIAPDAVIFLEPGEYNLTEATDYGGLGGQYYTWSEEFDGFTLELRNVENLQLLAGGPDKVSLVTVPRYADVLRLDSCRNVTLKGFTAGHTPEQGSCTGDVLTLVNSSELLIENCSLFGCGVHGIVGENASDVQVTQTEIHDCEYDAVVLWGGSNVAFTDCSFYNNGVDDVSNQGCYNLTINGNRIPIAGS